MSPEILLLSGIIDRLNLLLWTKTKDAEKGWNRPKPILESLYQQESNVSAFTSGKEFEKEWKRLAEGR